MYLGIEDLMDKVMEAVRNGKSDEFTLLDQEFIELFLSISEFDKKKKQNAIDLKAFVKALADQCPTTFPKYE